METYLTIEGLAEYLKLAEQTVRRWVLNREVPYHYRLPHICAHRPSKTADGNRSKF